MRMTNLWMLLMMALVCGAVACETPQADAPKTETPKAEAPKADDMKKAAPDTKAAPAAEAPKTTPASAKADLRGAKPLDTGDGHFGGPFKMKEAITVGTVLAAPEKYQGKEVQVSGKISNVCKKKGCWFVIQDETKTDENVRITMKDYGFFVPRDAAGKKAVIEGTFSLKLMKEAERKHLAEDGGKDPSVIKGDVKEFSLVATGVNIIK